MSRRCSLCRVLFLPLLLAFSAGCAQLTTYGMPEVLEPDAEAWGVGASCVVLADSDNPMFFPSVWYRRSLTENTDVGYTVGFPDGLAVDLRHAFVAGDFMLSGDLGLSYAALKEGGGGGILLRPEILLGTERLGLAVWALGEALGWGGEWGGWWEGDELVYGARVTGSFGEVLQWRPTVGWFDVDGGTFFVGIGLEQIE